MADQIAEFDEAMMAIYRIAKSEAGYNATAFLNMLLRDRGLRTAKYLINSGVPSAGYTALHLKGRLDLTVEALVVEGAQWHCLFSEEEIARARRRLKAFGYSSS